MDEGIRINDAACEISPNGLEALLAKRGGEIRLTRLDCSISEAALNALLQSLAPGAPTPRARVEEGRVTVENMGPDAQHRLELDVGGLRLEISGAGLRLRTDSAA